MKIVYAGSPEFAVAPLKALVESGKEVVAVISQPDRPVGRKGIITPTPVKAEAIKLGIPVYTWDKISRNVEELKSLGGDIMITCAYGQILSQAVLNTFPKGVWNIHASLLPKYRGASPIQAAILGGEEVTGVTVMRTELSLDTGDMLLVKKVDIGEKNCAELTDALSIVGAEATVEAVELLEKGDFDVLVQDDSLATYCKKITRQEAKIDFNASAEEICLIVRAMNPSPLAHCLLNGNVFNIYRAQPIEGEYEGKVGEVVKADKGGLVVKCKEGAISILEGQLSGSKVLGYKDLVNGRKLKVGDVLE